MYDSLEYFFIGPIALIWDILKIKSDIEEIIINPINPKRYNPLSGSFAKECTLSIIPDLTINAPNKLKEKTKIANRIVHILKWEDLIETFNEWINAVAASHGISAIFSTGSQNQYPPHPNS